MRRLLCFLLVEMSATLLIVDDEKNTRDGLRNALDTEFEVYVAPDVDGALATLESVPVDVVLTDLRLGGDDGMSLIERIVKKANPPICIMMTAYGSVDTAVEAMKRGAYDFVTKPVNIDRLEILIKRALRERNTNRENKELRSKVQSQFRVDGMIGRSPAMVEVFDTIKQVAPSRATVLVQGESGTGKELAAHAIHELSPRSKEKFVAVHCASLTPELLASELFGHEKGAFTGAFERRIGRFEQAKGGTLFLDEIGEIDLTTQVKILRVLGERTFERVGGGETLAADVRLIAATNKNLSKLVAEGKFRDDLFFRLHVVPLTMPPLRDRKVDIPLLVDAFLRETALENGKPHREISPEAMEKVLEYDWPGNVRELRTAVEHGVVMASGPQITLRDMPATLRLPKTSVADKSHATTTPSGLNLRDTETSLILRALEDCRENRSEAAKKLGISRRTLHRRLKELNLFKRLPNT
jgi:DNA-binding NtrC family response regulator